MIKDNTMGQQRKQMSKFRFYALFPNQAMCGYGQNTGGSGICFSRGEIEQQNTLDQWCSILGCVLHVMALEFC